jgi:hypothetical protein
MVAIGFVLFMLGLTLPYFLRMNSNTEYPILHRITDRAIMIGLVMMTCGILIGVVKFLWRFLP